MIVLKKVILIVAIAISFQGFSQKQNRTLLAVKFHADWCGNCLAMEPAYEEVQTRFNKRDHVQFIKLDFTNKETTNQAMKIGESLGITPIIKENNRRTGFVLIIDEKTKKVLSKLTRHDNVDVMEQKIKKLNKGKTI